MIPQLTLRVKRIHGTVRSDSRKLNNGLAFRTSGGCSLFKRNDPKALAGDYQKTNLVDVRNTNVSTVFALSERYPKYC